MDGYVLVDTNGLVHRITPFLVMLGLLRRLVVRKSISLEIHRLLASPYPDKQQVGRQALLALATFHSQPGIEIIMDSDEPTSSHPDNDLINFALCSKMPIYTEDAGLQKKARAQNVEVIATQYYDDIFRQVTPQLVELFPPPQELPAGTILTIRITKLGNKPGEGIGYLPDPDRRKIIVESGERYLGEALRVKVTGTHQPESGPEVVFAVPAMAERIEDLDTNA